MSSPLQDLRYAVRSLTKNHGFTVVALLTLALGIGANTAIFSVVNAVLVRPLPYQDSERLVRVYSVDEGDLWTASPADYTDWRSDNRSFEEMGAFYQDAYAMGGEQGAQRLLTGVVTASLFTTLGASPMLGRAFGSEDEIVGQDHVVILSQALWEQRFASDPLILGRSVMLDGELYDIIGVMPESYRHPGFDADQWVPLAFDEDDLTTQRGAHYLTVVARLKPEVTIEAANSDMEVIAARLQEEYPGSNLGWSATVRSLREATVGDVRPAFLILLGAVGLVLLIACANVANLSLARALGRERELAIRMALGGSRFRVFRGLLTESVVLGVGGGIIGLLVATWGTSFLVALAPTNIPRLDGVSFDATVLLFAFLVSALAGLLFGIIPALRASLDADISLQLKAGGRGLAGDQSGARTRSALVVAQIGLAVMLVVGSGLLIKSFLQTQSVDPGFNAEGVHTFRLSVPRARYPEPEDVERFYAELLTEVRALPGVTRAGAIFGLPMSDFGYSISVEIIDGRDLETEESHSLSVQVRVVTSDFLETIQAPLLRGRGITEADRYGAPPVVVVSESAARLLWPNEDALGRTFEIGTSLGIRRGNRVGGEVIGVVRDIKGQGLDADARPKIYASHAQFPTRYMGIAVRSEGDPATTIGPIRRWLAARDPALPMFEVASLGELVNASIAQRRFYMLLLTAFALTALALASVGVYGVMSYSVARRTNEFGIRMALGASPEELLSLVLRRGFVLALAGVGIGVVASFASTRLLANLLFGTSAVDPATFLAVAALLTGVALLACFVPARRATRVDPLVALKYE